MKKKSAYIVVILFLHYFCGYAQQVIVDNSFNPTELIQSLVGTNCVLVENVSSPVNGSNNNIVSYGTFTNANSNFPLQNGIVLSTGNVLSSGNTVIGNDLSEGNLDWTTDEDILAYTGIDQTLNATSLEFDFTSTNDVVSFKFVLASEEYQQEFPCNFSDIFAILIRPADSLEPFQNIAVIPNDPSEISTSNIRPNIEGICEAQNEEFFQGYSFGGTNFNGQTIPITASANIIPNETYHIKFIIADHIDQRFDSAVFIEGESFAGAIDLGPDQSVCGDNLILNADTGNFETTYTWFYNGSPVPGENNSTLEANQSGTYSVQATTPSSAGECLLSDSINIALTPFQTIDSINDEIVCDDLPSDGISNFDFPSLKNDEILSSLPSLDYIISYHLSEDDALNNSNALPENYENSEQSETIYVRIESLSGDCLQIGSFNISVNNSPDASAVTLSVCQDEISADFPFSDLNSLDQPITNFSFDPMVQYFLTEEDALNDINQISELPSLESQPESFFAKVSHTENDCTTIVTISFEYQEPPNIDIDKFVFSSCVDPSYIEVVGTSSGPETLTYDSVSFSYNLLDYVESLEQQYPELTFRILLFIASFPPIITTNQRTLTIPIGVSGGDFCEVEIPMEIHKNVLFNVLGDERSVALCDDISNDGVVEINMTELSEEISNDFELSIAFYETQEDRDNQINEIDVNQTVSVTNGQTYYIRSSFEECTHDSSVTLTIESPPEVSPQLATACGLFNDATNTSIVQLNPFRNLASQGLTNVEVNFYNSQDDALNDINRIESIETISDNVQVFTRVTNVNSGCFNISTIDISISNNLSFETPNPIIACDDNQDGFTLVNLESVLDELGTNLSDYEIVFFETLEDALSGRNEIENPSNYNAQTQQVFIKLQVTNLEDCFTIVSFNVEVYLTPILDEIPPFVNCSLNNSDFSDFLLIDQDGLIINDQENVNILYFETESDALNRINIIDKTVVYQNNSNPQTIYVRSENEIENNCFQVLPMLLEVKEAPIFNLPSDIIRCDDDGDGSITLDLSLKVSEIVNGSLQSLDVSFFISQEDALENSNPLPTLFNTIEDPQLVYARVTNLDTDCFEIVTFSVSVLDLPDVNTNITLEQCANNFQFQQSWNLTEVELLILNGRQFGVEFQYFESEEDLLNDSNEIQNPENYVSNSANQFIYAKVINTTTQCFISVPFELISQDPPLTVLNEFYYSCENDENLVDLSEISGPLLDDNSTISISFFTSFQDADNNLNDLNSSYSYSSNLEQLFARVQSETTGCYAIYPLEIIISPPPIFSQPRDLMACDDDFDGILEFDLTQQNSNILAGQDESDFTITFYNSADDAQTGINQIDTNYFAFNDETIHVRIENNLTGCYSTSLFNIIIHPLPVFEIGNQVLCLDNLPLLVSANTNNPSDEYLWSTGETAPEIEIMETGEYWVMVTTEFGCEFSEIFNVTESESATIETTETIDFSDPNNIIITVSGIGDYLYQLDNGIPQESNVFTNVTLGYHTITIIDKNGCNEVTKEVLVIDFPKFMTPNGDGQFDTWHLIGSETLPGSIIKIYDRYGKLIKELTSTTPGWDGRYNGNLMPSSDYWFVADIIRDNQSFQIKGHFTLKR